MDNEYVIPEKMVMVSDDDDNDDDDGGQEGKQKSSQVKRTQYHSHDRLDAAYQPQLKKLYAITCMSCMASVCYIELMI